MRSEVIMCGAVVRNCIIKAHSRGPCRAPAVPCRANSHIPCCASAVLRQCRVLRESQRVAGKKPNLRVVVVVVVNISEGFLEGP